MNKKFILTIIFSIVILGAILLTIVTHIKQININSTTEIDKQENDNNLQYHNIIKNEGTNENIEEKTANEIKNQSIENNTNENANNNMQTDTIKNTNIITQNKTKDKNNNINNNTNKKVNNTITVNSTGSYDIKNGGSATYSDEVEIPKEWLDY